VEGWSFLTNHARVLLCIAHDPGDRLRDTAASPSITERSAHGIITDLTTAGYTVKQKDGRRNRYQIQAHMPLREPARAASSQNLRAASTRRPVQTRMASGIGRPVTGPPG
jgi:hypothetical protein